jgi:hypothetical protein
LEVGAGGREVLEGGREVLEVGRVLEGGRCWREGGVGGR